MNLAKKLVSVAAGVALVAGVGLAAAPASAKINKKNSATIISFKKDLVSALETQGIQISAQAPATWDPKKALIRFPVTKVTSEGISHSGGLIFTKNGAPLLVTDPFIATPAGATEFNVLVNTATFGQIPLLVLKTPKASESCKVDGSKKKKWIKKTTTRIKAFAHFTSDPTIVAALQQLVSPLIEADLGVGQGRVTIEDDVNSKKKPKC
jgi:predicted secreted protein